jgi:5-methylcytosine-specific restriction protein A
MPSYNCSHPTCTTYLKERGYCEAHQQQGKKAALFYDQHLRNPDAKAFYNSAAWKRARSIALATAPWCNRCKIVFAEHVHHIKPLADCDAFERLDQPNLMPLCASCHNHIEAEAKRQGGVA